MVRRKKKEQTSLWAQLLILFTVMSFRRSKLRSLAAVVSSSRRRRNGATAVVGEPCGADRLWQLWSTARWRFQEEKRTKVREAPSKLR